MSMTPTTQPAEHTLPFGIQRLTGAWIARCCVCKKQYAQHCGSTPCCGSVAEIIAHDPGYCIPAPESAIEQAREALALAIPLLETLHSNTLDPKLRAFVYGRVTKARKALSNLTPATDKQG